MASLFTRIINRELPAEFVHEDDLCVAIKDIAPKAPVHLLIIPREELVSLDALASSHGPLAARLLAVASELAKKHGLDKTGWRLVANNGKDGGQVVPHLHFHLIGGRALGDLA